MTIFESTVAYKFRNLSRSRHSCTITPFHVRNIVLGTGNIDNIELGRIQKDIVNKTGTVLPETGAEGTFFLITGSTLLVMVAAVFMITRKKMSIYED